MTLGKMVLGDRINWVLHNKKFVFMILKKCASVTMKKVILSSLGYEDVSSENINRLTDDYFPLSMDKYKLDALDYDKVVWVRNPFDRLVSAWSHRVRNNKKHSIRDYGIPHTTSFEDYIDYICSFKDEDLNVHFHQQTFNIAINDRLVPNIVVKIENLQEEWERVRERFEWLAPIKWHAHKSEKRGDYRRYYTKDLIKKVNNRFAKDLELLGYEF